MEIVQCVRMGDNKLIPLSHTLPIAGFIMVMVRAVAERRQQARREYYKECAQFVTDVTGWHPSQKVERPDSYDWTVAGAIEMAEAMLEYDHG